MSVPDPPPFQPELVGGDEAAACPVIGRDHDDPPLVAGLRKDATDQVASSRVQPGERFVDEECVRIRGEHTRQADTPRVPAERSRALRAAYGSTRSRPRSSMEIDSSRRASRAGSATLSIAVSPNTFVTAAARTAKCRRGAGWSDAHVDLGDVSGPERRQTQCMGRRPNVPRSCRA